MTGSVVVMQHRSLVNRWTPRRTIHMHCISCVVPSCGKNCQRLAWLIWQQLDYCYVSSLFIPEID